jgi:L-fucose isomerase
MRIEAIDLAGGKAHCPEKKDDNSESTKRSREQLDSEWEDSTKMALIARDLIVSNEKLAEASHAEQAPGHHAIAAGFPGQRHWTDHLPNGDFMEAIMNTSFDSNGKPHPTSLPQKMTPSTAPVCSSVNC